MKPTRAAHILSFILILILTGCYSTSWNQPYSYYGYENAAPTPNYSASASTYVPDYTVPLGGSPQVIESQIDGDYNGWDGETIVKLTNGQIWQQTEYYYYYRYAFMPHVLVYRSSGGYKMKVEGIEKAVRVERLK